MSSIKEAEFLSQIAKLTEQVQHLEDENTKLKIVFSDYSVDLSEADDITDSEALCVTQIELLRKESNLNQLTLEQSKIFETLNKQLALIRTGSINRTKKKFKVKEATTDELLQVLDGGK